MKKTLLSIGIVLIVLAIVIFFVVLVTKPSGPTPTPGSENKVSEETKMKIIHREETNVAPDVKQKVVEDYLDECHEISNSEKSIECLEEFYTDDYIVEMKNECEGKEGQAYDSCKDYYYNMQSQNALDITFCEGIKDGVLKEECLTYNN